MSITEEAPVDPGPPPSTHVEILRWPADAGRRGALLEEGRPCLWLVAHGELLPSIGPNEDWVRLPADERDLHARLQHLRRPPRPTKLAPGAIRADEDGIVHWGEARAMLPAIEATILNHLGETPGRVVPRAELVELIWGDRPPSARALDSRLHTLRVRVEPLRLRIHTIRGQGFLLEARPPTTLPPAPGSDPPRSKQWSNS